MKLGNFIPYLIAIIRRAILSLCSIVKENWLSATIASICGAILSLCYPGVDLGGLVWVWMLPLLPIIWRGKKKRYGFAIAYIAGFTFWCINLRWIGTVSGIGVPLIAGYLSLYFGFWGMIAITIGNPWKKKEAQESAKEKTQSSIEEKIAQKKASLATKTRLPKGALSESLFSLKFAAINSSAWVSMEWLRGWVITGFSWNGLGVAFHDTLVLAQFADVVGVTGLAFMPVFMSAVIIQTGRRLLTEIQRGRLRPRLDFSIAAVLLVLQFCYGVFRMNQVNDWETQRVRVLLVQENIRQDLKWDPGEAISIINGYAESTIKAYRNIEEDSLKAIQEAQKNNTGEVELTLDRPDFIIWPESAFPYNMMFVKGTTRRYFYPDIHELIAEQIWPLGNFTLISGTNEFEGKFVTDDRMDFIDDGEQYNAIAMIQPGEFPGQNIQTYRKMHLVLFGEYIPYSEDFPIIMDIFEKISGVGYFGNFESGTSYESITLPTADGDIHVIGSVCYEDTVGRLTRKFARAKPQVIINVTNDGWFGESHAAEQHMINGKFRAIELRRPLIRSANTGVSCIISSTGSLQDSKTRETQIIRDESGSHFTRDTLFGNAYAPKHGPLTIYALLGDWFCYLMIAMTAFLIIQQAIRNRLYSSDTKDMS